MKSTLYIHAGGPKAGSSAIQNFLHSNSSFLLSNGFSYRIPNDPSYEVELGNCNELFKLFTGVLPQDFSTTDPRLIKSQKLPSESSLLRLIKWHFDGCSKSLISSEYLTSLNVDAWHFLHETLTKNGIKVVVIYYVRQPLKYFVSSYSQSVKNHGYFKDFISFIKIHPWEHYKFIKMVVEFIAREDLLIFQYDNYSKDVISHLKDSIFNQINFPVASSPEPIVRINRSLSVSEIQIIASINKILGRQYGNDLSIYLMKFEPLTPFDYDFYLTKEAVNLINSKCAEGIKFFAKNFNFSFPIFQRNSVINAGTVDNVLESLTSSLKITISWVANKLKDDLKSSQTLSALAMFAKTENPPHLPLPDSFDPVYYLLLNQDLLLDGNDPYEHYLAQGYTENRKYTSQINRVPSKSYEELLRRINAGLIITSSHQRTTNIKKSRIKKNAV